MGLDYETAQIKVRDANLNLRLLVNRHDVSPEPGMIVTQTLHSDFSSQKLALLVKERLNCDA
jgi:hypothetical protein